MIGVDSSTLPKRKLIYIMGAGRSGTTMLDILLGNGKDNLSLGELTRYFELGGIPRNNEVDTVKDRFWKYFQKTYELKLGHEINFEEVYSRHRTLEHPKQFLTNFLGRNTQSEQSQYKKEMEIFFEVLSEIVNEAHIVDSSKYQPRALNLGRVFKGKTAQFELCFVYLVRDPVSVIQSFGKNVEEQVSRHWFSANIYFFLINLFSSLTLWKLKGMGYKTMKVKYEDYVQEPIECLSVIEKSFDIDLSQTKARIQAGDDLEIGPLFDGNRLRLKESVKLRLAKPIEIKSFVDLFSRLMNKVWY